MSSLFAFRLFNMQTDAGSKLICDRHLPEEIFLRLFLRTGLNEPCPGSFARCGCQKSPVVLL